MNELIELRDQAYENSLIYKTFSGKLKTRWTRPITFAQVLPYGTIELSQTDRPNFKVGFAAKWESSKEAIEVDIIKKTENQAKMTKLSMEWKRLCKIKAKVQKCQRNKSESILKNLPTGAGTEEYY
ncbi:hypothetical protein Tco_0622884 [Tanacetum coccineum]